MTIDTNKFILYFLCGTLLLGACNSTFYKDSGYQISKIDSVNDYYFIYATKNEKLYKIVSSKEKHIKGKKILVGKKYNFDLKSIWNQPILINGVNIIPASLPNINCIGLDDSTTMCLERENSINDIYRSSKIRGLYLEK